MRFLIARGARGAYVQGPKAGRLERAESVSDCLTGSLTEGVKGRPNGGVPGALPGTPSGGCALDAGSARPLTVSGAAGEKVWPGAFPGLTFSPADASPARGFPFTPGTVPDHDFTPTQATLRGACGRLRPAVSRSRMGGLQVSAGDVLGVDAESVALGRNAVVRVAQRPKVAGTHSRVRRPSWPVWAALSLVLASCGTVAPLVRCVPDSQLHPCPEARP